MSEQHDPVQQQQSTYRWSYDAARNQVVVNGDTVTYDAENRQVSTLDTTTYNTESYAYDGDGKRVQKSGPDGSTVYVYDALGRLAGEYSTVQNTSRCTTCYLTYDHLGSVRMVTDQNATVISRHDYLPFGEEIPTGDAQRVSPWGLSDNVSQRFTGDKTGLALATVPILIPEARLAHVLEMHSLGGALTAGKSLFNAGEDIKGLVQAAETAPVRQVGNVLIRTVDAGRIIGSDRNTGQVTSMYTVITKTTGELITAHPGLP